uniref:Uncharacterized protein n=1 Tax=Kalanchoe fedtschenkoi TaxID=63787 RepID=A0A7N0ZRR1_KALFE
MERKKNQSSVSARSPARLRSMIAAKSGVMSSFFRRGNSLPESDGRSRVRSASLRPGGEALEPLMEGPEPDGRESEGPKSIMSGLVRLMTRQLLKAPSFVSGMASDLRFLLGVMGAPLAPVHAGLEDSVVHLSIKDGPIERVSAQYILHQYTAASATRAKKSTNSSQDAQSGGFVIWQMNPGKWYVELAVGNSKVHAGCDGKLVWRHTPWLGAHTAKGPIRPLRRALQGLDPKTTASIFTGSRCVGEKRMNEEDCFILELCADPETLKARAEVPAEIIRHVMVGYFSQKTGLLIHLEDSHLTRIQPIGTEAVYWETTIHSFIDDYRSVEGIMIAHSGRSSVTVFKFGETATSNSKTIMEEAWTIEEVAYNIPGLSGDSFIPPSDLRTRSICETRLLPPRSCGMPTRMSDKVKIRASDEEPENRSDGFSLKMNV